MGTLFRLLARIPYSWLHAAGGFLGWLVWTLRIRRGVVLSNLELAFPEKSERERRDIALQTYLNLGRTIPEFLRIPYLSREELERILVFEGWEVYEQAIAKGKGVIGCSAHFGNFDLLAAAQALRGIPITMISRRMGKSGANDLWREARRRSGVQDLQVSKGETLKAALRALKDGRVLGYVIDQNQPLRRAIFPTFFGVPAATAATPAWLALRTGAPVVFGVSVPMADGRHKVIVEGPIVMPDTGDRERDVLAFMQELNDRLERLVRLYPDRWYWLHRRWKTRPAGETVSPFERGAPAR